MSGSFFARRGAAQINELNRSLAGLLGIATGILADRQLNDAEIQFLEKWLDSNSAIANTWPGDVVHARVKAVLGDGLITHAEREHLTQVLQQLVGGTLEELSESRHVTNLAFDSVETIQFAGSAFCLTGDFVYAPRELCSREIETRGGIVKGVVSKKVRYVIVGGLGSPEWKHGSFGTKIDQAMKLKRDGVPLSIVHEETWSRAL